MTSNKHRILFQTDPLWVKTGLAENMKTLMKYLYSTGKYEIALYCVQGTLVSEPKLNLYPWKMFGCIPHDQQIINEINADPYKGRNAAYGAYRIDEVIKEFKPTIWVSVNDSWQTSKADYLDKGWFSAINSLLHITIDSLPLQDAQIEQAKICKNYFTWAKFAEKELKRFGNDFSHVKQIYGCMDTEAFSKISHKEKSDLRERFKIDSNTTLFLYVFRNQLRKQAPIILEAFAKYKSQNSNSNVKLHFHTSFSEKGNGWDIPALMRYYGIDPKDVLCTYVCKECGNWHVAPYTGEDINCPHCLAEKTCVTANIKNGVEANEMRYIYGLSDASISAFSSGGLEYHNVQSLLCELPLACTNYSCGEDFCTDETKDFVTPLSFHVVHEASTNFIKSATDIGEITQFIRKIHNMSKVDRESMGKKGREWAKRIFSIEVIGKQWEKVFDALPIVNWDDIDLSKVNRKNEDFPFDSNPETSEVNFIKNLYKNVLLSDEPESSEGFRHWMDKLKNGVSRKDIHDYFIGVAKSDNLKSDNANNIVPFESVLDENGRKRALFVCPQSIGDIIICTSLLKSFKETYPDTDLYFATKRQFIEVVERNEYIHKVIEYNPAFENELWAIGVGSNKKFFDYYINPMIPTQKNLMYLSKKEPAFNIETI